MATVSPRRIDPGWQHPLAGGLRKVPMQERSRAMVQKVLDVASELVQNVGFEAVIGSPTLLLERSGVSRGSFYAFFETPERVLDELTYQQIIRSVAELRSAVERRQGSGWEELVDVLVDAYVEDHRQPLTRELWVRQNLTHRARETDERAIDDLARFLLEQFRAYAPLFDSLTEVDCVVAISALERACQAAFRDDPDGDPAVIASMRTLLRTFFASHAGSPGA